MRVIKFRARWKDTGLPIPKFMEEYTLECLNDSEMIIEQFTGEVDSFGEELFEGDKVTGYCWPSGRTHEFEIKFSRGRFILYRETGDVFTQFETLPLDCVEDIKKL